MAARKLLFYTHAMSGGGAERVWALLASGFARCGDSVTLAVDFEAQDKVRAELPALANRRPDVYDLRGIA